LAITVAVEAAAVGAFTEATETTVWAGPPVVHMAKAVT